jgi:hypothetical protein
MFTFLSHTCRVLAVAVVALSFSAPAAAQVRSNTDAIPGGANVTTTEFKGEVVNVKGDSLVAKMIPSGEYRLFQMRPGTMGTIDGVTVPLNTAKIGTVLTLFVTVVERPVLERTVMTLAGTVLYTTPTSVILALDNGDHRQYEVQPGLRVNVNGEMKEPKDLAPGTKITATKIVEAPITQLSESKMVTGVAPK